MKLILSALFYTATLLSVSLNSHASGSMCKEIGGMALANAIDDSHMVAALSGELSGGARAEITAQKKTSSGLSLEMTHHFISDKGGLLKTQDTATLTAVPNKHKTYMLEIAYNVVEASGIYAGYTGHFQSFGLINLDKGKAVLRYTGSICK